MWEDGRLGAVWGLQRLAHVIYFTEMVNVVVQISFPQTPFTSRASRASWGRSGPPGAVRGLPGAPRLGWRGGFGRGVSLEAKTEENTYCFPLPRPAGPSRGGSVASPGSFRGAPRSTGGTPGGAAERRAAPGSAGERRRAPSSAGEHGPYLKQSLTGVRNRPQDRERRERRPGGSGRPGTASGQPPEGRPPGRPGRPRNSPRERMGSRRRPGGGWLGGEKEGSSRDLAWKWEGRDIVRGP